MHILKLIFLIIIILIKLEQLTLRSSQEYDHCYVNKTFNEFSHKLNYGRNFHEIAFIFFHSMVSSFSVTRFSFISMQFTRPQVNSPSHLCLLGILYTEYLWHKYTEKQNSEFFAPLWQPTPVFLPGESQGQGSLVGCRLWGRIGEVSQALQ